MVIGWWERQGKIDGKTNEPALASFLPFINSPHRPLYQISITETGIRTSSIDETLFSRCGVDIRWLSTGLDLLVQSLNRYVRRQDSRHSTQIPPVVLENPIMKY